MARWMIYVRERFPPVVYLLLAGGITLSGTSLPGQSFLPIPLALSFAGLLIFFAELRLMDELKDYETDVLAHPERPLPRGLLTRAEVGRTISWGIALLVLWAVISTVLIDIIAGSCFLLVTAWLYLMYKEFFIGEWLSQRPLLYASSHQVVILPLAAYPILCADPVFLRAPQTYAFCLMTIGAFFSYEVCRKLDPAAHPALKTYLSVYGRFWTAFTVGAATLLEAYGVQQLNLSTFLWPLEALLVVSLALLWIRPGAYKLLETLAGISLLIHLWCLALLWLTGLR